MNDYIWSATCRQMAGVIAIACAMFTSTGFALDPVNQEALPRIQLRLHQQTYLKVSGNAPTIHNLVTSVGIHEAAGLKAQEVVCALDILKTMVEVISEPTMISAIEACFAQNSFWVIKVKCAETMLIADLTRGVALAEKIFASDLPPEHGKLMICHSLIKAGVLSSYGFVRDVYLTGSDRQKSMAMSILNDFKLYNGRAWNSNGDKIDVGELMSKDERPAKPDRP